MQLQNTSAVVTGGASGLGHATATALAGQGALSMLAGRSSRRRPPARSAPS